MPLYKIYIAAFSLLDKHLSVEGLGKSLPGRLNKAIANNMDEDEELYRLMNDEDDFYMGDDEGDLPEIKNYSPAETKDVNPPGCSGCCVLLAFVGLVAVYLLL
ncbi:MAG: hypothetical protein LBF62_12910 [Tannerellaceae bacterium]|nr:hypothetical protein [Tannerellaceae bacterium]